MKKLISLFNSNSSLLWKNLPIYIKIFSIYFSILAFVYTIYLVGFLFNVFPQVGVNFWGLRSRSVTTDIGLLMISISLFKAFIAYSLYKGKSFAVLLGYIDAILGIALWLFIALEPVFLDKLIFPHVISFHIFFLIPYAFIMAKFLFPPHQNVKWS